MRWLPALLGARQIEMLFFFCGYHGWHDWYQSANYLVDPESGEYPFAGIEPIGVPRALAGTAIPFTYGDLDMLGRLLTEYQGRGCRGYDGACPI